MNHFRERSVIVCLTILTFSLGLKLSANTFQGSASHHLVKTLLGSFDLIFCPKLLMLHVELLVL